MSEGKYLLYRHEILHHFLCVLNHSNDELEQVEKIEHFMDRKTILQIEKLTLFLENHHDYDQ
jgi:DtxR family Mn-dependent transcriptional regulator